MEGCVQTPQVATDTVQRIEGGQLDAA